MILWCIAAEPTAALNIAKNKSQYVKKISIGLSWFQVEVKLMLNIELASHVEQRAMLLNLVLLTFSFILQAEATGKVSVILNFPSSTNDIKTKLPSLHNYLLNDKQHIVKKELKFRMWDWLLQCIPKPNEL